MAEMDLKQLDRQAQIELLLERYQSPKRKYALEDAQLTMDGGNPGCGDVIKLFLRFDGEQLSQISFEGQGCTISQASTDILLELVEGKTVAEIDEIDHQALIEMLGKEIVQNRTKCALLPLDTLKLALRKRHEQQIRAASE